MTKEKMTLVDLLTQYGIYIPVIQRDYAQGRESAKAIMVRENLVKDIYEVLATNNEAIDFNFVYGTVKKESETQKIFYPVDGQQRLTTLYLLHWYLACQNDKLLEAFRKLNAFSYRTRNSAADFFNLIKHSDEEVVKIIRYPDKSLKTVIEDQSWFQAEWRFDPTVKSALNMLDAFNEDGRFRKNAEEFYKRLTEDAIFFTLITENEVLTEDGKELIKGDDESEKTAAKSYIRMNARGKALEDFENLKAMLDRIEVQVTTERQDLSQCNVMMGNGFIAKYDNTYIDYFFYEASKALARENENFLETVTKKINETSYTCFRNIFNLACDVFLLDHNNSKLATACQDNHSFMNKIYSLSQKSSCDGDEGFTQEEKSFIEMYFCMLGAVLEYVSNNKGSKNAMLKVCYGFDEINNIAQILYLYHAVKNNKSMTVENLNLLIYVLDNLKYMEWSARGNLKHLNNFIEAVAKCDDIYEFFRNQSLDKIKELMNYCRTNDKDIQVRLKEQQLKCMIINDNKLDNYFFKTQEEKFTQRKLQAWLYAAGYWEETNQGCFDTLKKYMEYIDKYFESSVADERLSWRQVYAIAAYLDENGSLMLEKDINENCGEQHIWKDENLFWIDEDETNMEKIALRLKLTKIAFDNIENVEKIIQAIKDKQLQYKECWLTHAIAGDKSVYLMSELEYKDENVCIKEGYRFDLFYLEIEKELFHGIKTTDMAYQKIFMVYSQRTQDNRTCIFDVCIPSDVVNMVKQARGANNVTNDIFAYPKNTSNAEEYEVIAMQGKYKYRIYRLDLSEHNNKQKILIEKYKTIIDNYDKNRVLKVLEDNSLLIGTNDGACWTRDGRRQRWFFNAQKVHYDKNNIKIGEEISF